MHNVRLVSGFSAPLFCGPVLRQVIPQIFFSREDEPGPDIAAGKVIFTFGTGLQIVGHAGIGRVIENFLD